MTQERLNQFREWLTAQRRDYRQMSDEAYRQAVGSPNAAAHYEEKGNRFSGRADAFSEAAAELDRLMDMEEPQS